MIKFNIIIFLSIFLFSCSQTDNYMGKKKDIYPVQQLKLSENKIYIIEDNYQIENQDLLFQKIFNFSESDFKSKEELQNSPNIEYWKKLQDIYNTEDIFAILKQRCGNCAAFNITDKMRDCIKKGIGDEAPTEPIIKVGEIGYCRFLKFKCAAARTCQAWVSGGPIKD